MNIKITKNEKETCNIELPDECVELIKTPEGFHQVMEDVQKMDELETKNKSVLMKEFFSSLTSLGINILNEYINKSNETDIILSQN